MNMENKKPVGIIILNWNGADLLRRYLPSVVECNSDNIADVVVVDNGSTDDSRHVLETEFPKVRTLYFSENYGYAEGYNRAIKELGYEYSLLLNSDVEVTPEWLRPLYEYMQAHSDVAACQPKLLSEKNRDAFEYAGACGGYIDRYGYPFCRGRIFDTIENDDGQYDYAAEVLWATGACMVVRASDFRLAGGFDARFFAHSEEIDLCWRLRLMGKKIYCIPDSYVFHIGGGTLPKNNPTKTYLNFRNNLTMLYKNLSDRELRHVMRVRLVLDYVAAFQALLAGRTGDFKAILNGRRAFKKWLPEYREVRREVQGWRVAGDVVGIYPRSILWQYYAKGHKKYAEIL